MAGCLNGPVEFHKEGTPGDSNVIAKSIRVIPKQLIHEKERKSPETANTNRPGPNEQVCLSPSLTLGQAARFAVPQFPSSVSPPWEKRLGFFTDKRWGK